MLYYTDTSGPSDSGFITGLVKAVEIAKHNGQTEVLLSIHTLSMLDGVITSTLGADVVKRFEKQRQANVDGVDLLLETERIKSRFKNGVIFAPFVSSKLLGTLRNDSRATDVIYVPWAESELAAVKKDTTAVQIESLLAKQSSGREET